MPQLAVLLIVIKLIILLQHQKRASHFEQKTKI